jgi:chitin deacetylase
MVFSALSALLLLPLLALAHPTPHPDDLEHPVKRSLPARWYQDAGHPAERLFRRQDGGNPTDGVTYVPVGSPQWAAGFPNSPPDSTNLPQEWVNALNTAVAAGKIPNIPLATINGGGPVYPQGVNAGGPDICSGTVRCRNPDDIWDAPNGTLAISFDDGPFLVSAHAAPSLNGPV